MGIAIGFVSLILREEGPGGKKKMKATKPMAMLMPILIRTLWYFFSKWFDPI